MGYCKILGTQSSASNDEVDRAYRELRMRYRLDECIAGDVLARRAAAAKTQELNQTYQEVLQRRKDLAASVESVNGGEVSLLALLKDRLEPSHIFMRTYFAPRIPSKSLRGALRGYGSGLKPKDVLVLIDDTVFGGGGQGAMLTQHEVRMAALWDAPFRRAWSEIRKLEVKGQAVFINMQRAMRFKMVKSHELHRLFEVVQVFVSSETGMKVHEEAKLLVPNQDLAVYQRANSSLIELCERLGEREMEDEGCIDWANAAIHFDRLARNLREGRQVDATVRELLLIGALSQKTLEVITRADAEIPVSLMCEFMADSQLVIELRLLLDQVASLREGVLRRAQISDSSSVQSPDE